MSRVFSTWLRRQGTALVVLVALSPLSPQAQTLIENVHGYTMKGGERVTFTAMAFDRGLVTAIYTDPQEAATATVARRIDGAGATLLPGLIDAHGHVTRHGRLLASVDLAGVASEQAAAAQVADYLRTQPGAARVTGSGWRPDSARCRWPAHGRVDRQRHAAGPGRIPERGAGGYRDSSVAGAAGSGPAWDYGRSRRRRHGR